MIYLVINIYIHSYTACFTVHIDDLNICVKSVLISGFVSDSVKGDLVGSSQAYSDPAGLTWIQTSAVGPYRVCLSSTGFIQGSAMSFGSHRISRGQ